MNVIAVMMARGEGSTLKRKNAYPVLGRPMLWWILQEAKKAKFIDHIFVWTEDYELQMITKESGCQVIPRAKEEVFYHGGFSNPNDWGPERNDFIRKFLWNESGWKSNSIDIRVDLNCNYLLMTAEILEGMYGKLMEDRNAKDIWPIARFHGDIFQLHGDALFPVWHCQNLPKQQYPKAVLRGSGICITHEERMMQTVELRSIYYEVEQKYLLDVHDKEDVELAEYYLHRRPKERFFIAEKGSISYEEYEKLTRRPGTAISVKPGSILK